MPQRYHLIQNAPKRPYIRLLIIGLLLADFGREVVRCTYGRLGTIVSMLEDTGDSEITNFDLSTLCHEDVLCFQITVEDFTIVNMLDRQRHLYEPI